MELVFLPSFIQFFPFVFILSGAFDGRFGRVHQTVTNMLWRIWAQTDYGG